jgi:hypothetical protein
MVSSPLRLGNIDDHGWGISVISGTTETVAANQDLFQALGK